MPPFLTIWSWLRTLVGTISKINPDHVAPNALGSRDILTIFLGMPLLTLRKFPGFGGICLCKSDQKRQQDVANSYIEAVCTRRFHRQQLFGSFKTSEGTMILIWVRVGDILTVPTNIFKHQPCIFLTSRFCLGYTEAKYWTRSPRTEPIVWLNLMQFFQETHRKEMNF